MKKTLCFIYTETTGLHQTNENVCKKNLFCFARLVVLNYEIGYVENKKFISIKKNRTIIKPRCMIIPYESIQYHKITQEEALLNGTEIEVVIDTFKKDISEVNILLSHNIDFHIKTILAEAVRYNTQLDLSKFIIIDTISFFHNYGFIKLKDLYYKLYDINSDIDMDTLTIIELVFTKLYSQYKKSLKTIS